MGMDIAALEYHEPKKRPTVSFRSAGGAEASFCELTE